MKKLVQERKLEDVAKGIDDIKRGLNPPNHSECPQMELRGTVTVIGDIIEPVVPEEDWDSLRE